MYAPSAYAMRALTGVAVSTNTSFASALLRIELVHALFVRLAHRLLNFAQTTDPQRVLSMVRTHIRYVLKHEAANLFATDESLEREILEVQWETVRDRYLKELEEDDELINKPAVRYESPLFSRSFWLAVVLLQG